MHAFASLRTFWAASLPWSLLWHLPPPAAVQQLILAEWASLPARKLSKEGLPKLHHAPGKVKLLRPNVCQTIHPPPYPHPRRPISAVTPREPCQFPERMETNPPNQESSPSKVSCSYSGCSGPTSPTSHPPYCWVFSMSQEEQSPSFDPRGPIRPPKGRKTPSQLIFYI